jgi:hypothetical protein
VLSQPVKHVVPSRRSGKRWLHSYDTTKAKKKERDCAYKGS